MDLRRRERLPPAPNVPGQTKGRHDHEPRTRAHRTGPPGPHDHRPPGPDAALRDAGRHVRHRRAGVSPLRGRAPEGRCQGQRQRRLADHRGRRHRGHRRAGPVGDRRRGTDLPAVRRAAEPGRPDRHRRSAVPDRRRALRLAQRRAGRRQGQDRRQPPWSTTSTRSADRRAWIASDERRVLGQAEVRMRAGGHRLGVAPSRSPADRVIDPDHGVPQLVEAMGGLDASCSHRCAHRRDGGPDPGTGRATGRRTRSRGRRRGGSRSRPAS